MARRHLEIFKLFPFVLPIFNHNGQIHFIPLILPTRSTTPSVMSKDPNKKNKMHRSRDVRKVNTWDRTHKIFRHMVDEQGDLMGMFVPGPAVQVYFVASSSYLI